MLYWTHIGKSQLPQYIYIYKGKKSDEYSVFFNKLHNDMYATWICKNFEANYLVKLLPPKTCQHRIID